MPNNTKEIKDKRQQYNTFLNYSMKENSDSKLYGRVTLTAISVLLIVCIFLFGLGIHLKKHPDSKLYQVTFIQKIMNKIGVKDDPNLEMPSFSRKQNILILWRI